MTVSVEDTTTAETVATKPQSSKGRILGFAFFGLCLLLVITAYAFTRPLEDFVAYWTAAHLLLAHQNPYSLGGDIQVSAHALGGVSRFLLLRSIPRGRFRSSHHWA